MNKKNVENDRLKYIISKMQQPDEIKKRIGILTSADGNPNQSNSSFFPNVNWPGKFWTVIGASVILDMLIDKIITASLGGPAGTVWLAIQMSLLFIDIVDPYGYNQALDKSTLDDMHNTLIEEVQKALNSKETKDKLLEAVPELMKKGLTEEEAINLLESRLKFWKQNYGPLPDIINCYSDFETSNTLSGPPGDSCNTTYKQYYEQFVVQNGELYMKPATPENNEDIDRAFSTIYAQIVKNNLKNYRESILKINLFVLIVIIIIILIIFYFKYVK